ncbi:MAG: hypothetical protein Q8R71_01290 [Phenylobacterium sp.]|nr:hypothetical protein [Phenylobacterium sp.]
MTAPPNITPRLVSVRDAAAYFGLPMTQFQRLRVGRVSFGAKVLYDMRALDAHLDALSGLASPSLTKADNDAEAALERFTASR